MAKETNADSRFPTPLLHMTYVLQQSSDALLESSLGVGLSSVRVMSALSERVPRSQQTVAGLLGQTESNVSRQLKVLKKQGLVSITKNRKDGRQKDVILTQAGRNKFKKSERLLAAQQKRLLSQKDSITLELMTAKLLSHL